MNTYGFATLSNDLQGQGRTSLVVKNTEGYKSAERSEILDELPF